MRIAHRHDGRGALLAVGVALLCVPAPSLARSGKEERRVEISPYIGVDQAVLANLKGYDDVLTFTNISAGVNASISTRRVEAQADLRYEHQFGWGKAGDQDLVSGIANASVNLIHNSLSLDAGALGTRIRTDGVNGANNALLGADGYSSQVYSAYAGPTLATHVGDFDVGAAYRLGYTRVDDGDEVTFPGGPALSSKSESVYHSLSASIGQTAGASALPFGWMVSGGYNREDTSELDQRFEDKWARADVTVPISPTVALVGGVGYENVQIRQRDVLRDGNGPVITANGHYATDESSPRALIYDQDGLIWDVGVMWRPSPRTSLEARVGRRYGSMHYEGSFSWQPSAGSSFGVVVYDSIDSFGRLINTDVASLTGQLNITRNPFSGDLSGCAFSTTGGGQCFNDALSGVTAANFRNRGIAAQYAAQNGRWNWGVGAGYSQRKFITPDNGFFVISSGKDEIIYANMVVGRELDAHSSIEANVYANHFDGVNQITNAGAYASYYRGLTRRITATAALGVDGTKASDVETVITALGMIGMRYQF